jgi:hypothetical protein
VANFQVPYKGRAGKTGSAFAVKATALRSSSPDLEAVSNRQHVDNFSAGWL